MWTLMMRSSRSTSRALGRLVVRRYGYRAASPPPRGAHVTGVLGLRGQRRHRAHRLLPEMPTLVLQPLIERRTATGDAEGSQEIAAVLVERLVADCRAQKPQRLA